jgi:GNAT superfamily N-acetyltransferase
MEQAPIGERVQTEVRRMEPADVPAFLGLIRALADYEHLPPPDAAAYQRLERDALADPPRFHTLLASSNGRITGYAVYFFTYSTFMAQPSLYLEDIFVLESERRNGAGRALMHKLAQEAVAAGCGRMEWHVLDWNTPSQAFYQQMGAAHIAEWQPYRVEGDALRALAKGSPIS